MNKDITILIAEDDRGHFVFARNYLRMVGIDNEIIWFSDGQQVLDFFCDRNDQHRRVEGRKYILLLDIQMPKIGGIKLLGKIRQFDNDIKKIPIVIVSSSPSPQTIAQCKEFDCVAYVIKPFIKDDSFVEAMNNAALAV